MDQIIPKVLLLSNLPEARRHDIARRTTHLLNTIGLTMITKGQDKPTGAYVELTVAEEYKLTPDEVNSYALVIAIFETNIRSMTTEQELTRGWLLGHQMGTTLDNKFKFILHDSQNTSVEQIATNILNHAYRNATKEI